MKLSLTAPVSPGLSDWLLRAPGIADGAALHRLVRGCPPLDLNSPYAYLLLCAHHAATCVVAEGAAGIAGLVSAYRLPQAPETVFVWQVAVAPTARGQGLALRMLEHLLARPALATRLHTQCADGDYFAREDFPDPQHEPERLLSIGPYSIKR